MRSVGYNTLVRDMQIFRAQGRTVDWIINMTAKEGDPSTETRLEKLRFLAEGSPTFRFILSQIRDYVLSTGQKPNKLIITEDTPLTAWYWEVVLNFLYIETEVLHSGLTNPERWALVKKFNDEKSSLRILILMYNVGAQGINLDPCCPRVLVATAAINASLEIQAWGRVIRVC